MKAAISDNKFLKVLIATQRAKQIRKGARPLIQSSSTRATRIALEEVEQGLIGFDFMPQALDLRSGRDNRVDSGQDGNGEGSREVINQPSVASLPSVASQLSVARIGD